MSSYVEIANLAAAKIGTEARLTAPDDDRVLARRVKSVWDTQRRAAIRDGAWNFAMAREALPALAAAVAHPWAYAYELPSASLRLIEVVDCVAASDYAVEGRNILCNVSGPLYIRFLQDVKEPGLWDETFADAFAARIAWKIGKSIAGSSYSENGGEAEYRRILADAKRVDALENPPIDQAEDDWIIARHSGSRTGDPKGWV